MLPVAVPLAMLSPSPLWRGLVIGAGLVTALGLTLATADWRPGLLRSPRGELLAVIVVGLIELATGGPTSTLEGLYLIPVLSAGLSGSVTSVAIVGGASLVTTGLVAAGAGAEFSAFLEDTSIDAFIWLLSGGLVAVQTRRTRSADMKALEAETQFRQLADYASDGIYRLRLQPEPRFEYVNPALERMTGFAAEEWYADPELTLKRVVDSDRELVAESRRTPTRAFTSRFRRRDGGIVFTELVETPVFKDGEFVAVQGIARDVTARAAAEEELREALRHEQEAAEGLRALDTMKNDFLRAVSHELRTPLTSVVGIARTMERTWRRMTGDQIDDLVHGLRASADKLNRLLADLLDVDRLSRGASVLKRSPADLVALSRDVVDELGISSHDVRVSGDRTPIEVDVAKVERIVENLVVNAVRYTPQRTPIWVSVDVDDERAELVVEDAGPGVPSELVEEIFEPFRQGADSSSSASPGTGIGLALVRRFADLHGGGAWLEQRAGGGSRFRVVLHGATVDQREAG